VNRVKLYETGRIRIILESKFIYDYKTISWAIEKHQTLNLSYDLVLWCTRDKNIDCFCRHIFLNMYLLSRHEHEKGQFLDDLISRGATRDEIAEELDLDRVYVVQLLDNLAMHR